MRNDRGRLRLHRTLEPRRRALDLTPAEATPPFFLLLCVHMRTQHSAGEVGVPLAGGGCSGGSSEQSPGFDSDCSPTLGLAGGVRTVRGVMSHYWSLESLHSTNGKTLSHLWSSDVSSCVSSLTSVNTHATGDVLLL